MNIVCEKLLPNCIKLITLIKFCTKTEMRFIASLLNVFAKNNSQNSTSSTNTFLLKTITVKIGESK